MITYKWVAQDFTSLFSPDTKYELNHKYEDTYVFTTLKSAIMYQMSDALNYDNRRKAGMILLKGESSTVRPPVGPSYKREGIDVWPHSNSIADFVNEFRGDFQVMEVIAECSWEKHKELKRAMNKATSRKKIIELLNTVLREWDLPEVPTDRSYQLSVLKSDQWYWDTDKERPTQSLI